MGGVSFAVSYDVMLSEKKKRSAPAFLIALKSVSEQRNMCCRAEYKYKSFKTTKTFLLLASIFVICIYIKIKVSVRMPTTTTDTL